MPRGIRWVQNFSLRDESKPMWNQRSQRRPAQDHSAGELVEHGLHLTESMAVAGARRAGDAGLEADNRFIVAGGFRERLRSHKVAGGVIGIRGQQRVKLGERRCSFAALYQFHGYAVARK